LNRGPLNDDEGQVPPGVPEPGNPFGGTGRPTMAVAAIGLGALSAWMFWIVNTFLDGGGWFDLIVGLVLDDLILAVGLFAVVLLIWAIFTPAWLSRLLASSQKKLHRAIALIGILFGVSLMILLLVFPVLVQLGIMR
jgi:hypothetical protein